MREVISTGKTVEQATENGCLELGLSREEVKIEVLEMPVKKLFKTIPAKVRVTSLVDAVEAKITPAVKKQAAVQPPIKQEIKKEEQPKAVTTKKTISLEKEEKILLDIEQMPRAKVAVEYMQDIFAGAGVQNLQVKAYKQGDATYIEVNGDNIEECISIRGDVIQALSYLCDRTVNRGSSKSDKDYVWLRLDVAGYRNRREKELLTLAEQTVNKVIESNRSITLSPMNPYERLIIHTYVSNVEGMLLSESVGSDVERRVVIKSTAPGATQGPDWKPVARKENGGRPRRNNTYKKSNNARSYNDKNRQSNNRGASQAQGQGNKGNYKASSAPEREYANRESTPQKAPIVPKPKENISDAADLPLYGKIDI